MDDAGTALSGFGQGSVTASPLQMAMVTAGIANHGVVMKPYVWDTEQSPTSFETVRQTESTRARPGDIVHDGQRGHQDDGRHRGVRHRCTGRDPRYPGGGQDRHGPERRPRPTARVRRTPGSSAFAPANAPKVAVAVMIQHVDRATRRDPRRHPRRPDRQVVMEAVLKSGELTRRPMAQRPAVVRRRRRYRLDSRIATGGMGEVWRATDTVLGRLSRSSCSSRSTPTTRSSASRFETEARHAAALHHPGIAPVFDFGELGDGASTGRTSSWSSSTASRCRRCCGRGSRWTAAAARDLLAPGRGRPRRRARRRASSTAT